MSLPFLWTMFALVASSCCACVDEPCISSYNGGASNCTIGPTVVANFTSLNNVCVNGTLMMYADSSTTLSNVFISLGGKIQNFAIFRVYDDQNVLSIAAGGTLIIEEGAKFLMTAGDVQGRIIIEPGAIVINHGTWETCSDCDGQCECATIGTGEGCSTSIPCNFFSTNVLHSSLSVTSRSATIAFGYDEDGVPGEFYNVTFCYDIISISNIATMKLNFAQNGRMSCNCLSLEISVGNYCLYLPADSNTIIGQGLVLVISFDNQPLPCDKLINFNIDDHVDLSMPVYYSTETVTTEISEHDDDDFLNNYLIMNFTLTSVFAVGDSTEPTDCVLSGSPVIQYSENSESYNNDNNNENDNTGGNFLTWVIAISFVMIFVSVVVVLVVVVVMWKRKQVRASYANINE